MNRIILLPFVLLHLELRCLVVLPQASDFFDLVVPQVKDMLDVRAILKLVITFFDLFEFHL